MDRLASEWFRWQAERAVLRKTANEFQDHFSDVMEAVHGPDFLRVRPTGRIGDRKCDGYLRSTHTMFQVYAPRNVVDATAVGKIDEDFIGAYKQWSTMKGWIFVHNDHDGLGPDAVQAILTIEQDHPELCIDQWGPQLVSDLTRDLPFERLQRLFGNPPTDSDMRDIGRGDIAVVVTGLALEGQTWTPGGTDLHVIDGQKLDYNGLSPHARNLMMAGFTQSEMVEEYFAQHLDPNLRDRTARLMKREWRALSARGVTGDAAFHALYDRITVAAEGSRQITAGLALLAHLFESCDVFDNPPPGWSGSTS